MCLALPARIVRLLGDGQALVDLDGVRRPVCVALVPEAREGDHVIVHVGYAIGLLDAEEAEQTLALMREMAGLQAGLTPPVAGT